MNPSVKLFVFSLVLTSACVTASADAPERIGSGVQEVSLTNAMSYNRLSFNRLSFNRLSFNRLSFNRLSFNRLSFNSLDGLETTPEGRELLLYIARCALVDGDILVAEHDGAMYELPGLLGLAPAWEHRGLDEHEQRLVSACLIAHVNAFGVSVPISLRAPGVLEDDAAERAAFPVYEATFFGNVFGDTLETYACIGDLPEVAAATSPDRVLRVCGDLGDDCPVVSLGRCRDVCDTRTPGHGWQGCWARDQRHDETISSYLRAGEDVTQRSCEQGGHCRRGVSPGDPGIIDCSDAGWCRAECKPGAICTLDGTSATRFRPFVQRGAVADVSCHDTGSCDAVCSRGSTCEIDCKDAVDCREVRCEPGAECLLDCTGAGDCGFALCQDGLQTCPGDIVVCNRSCP